MKTLDEVIKAIEICWEQGTCSRECPYMMEEPSCGIRRELDALHYLRELQLFRETPLMQGIHKAQNEYALYPVSDWGEDEPEFNPALTWDELKQMFHRPIWIETKTKKGWVIINNFEAVTPNNENMNVIHTSHRGAKCSHFARHLMGETWQAYRKERHEDLG